MKSIYKINILFYFVLLVCAEKCISQQNQQSKQALLIANSNYLHFGKLPNPLSDARLLGKSLETIGFEVFLLENANREQMLDAVNAFQEKLTKTKKGIAFFHYGGHGVQVAGKNYLIPTDADIPDEKKVSTRALDLEEIMTSLELSGAEVNIIVLDACRDNPLPKVSSRGASRGLSVVETKPKDSIIVYAAQPGSKAEDGLFTPALAKALLVPGRSITQIMTDVRREVYELSHGQQTPGEYNQLFSEVFLCNGVGPIDQQTKAEESLPIVKNIGNPQPSPSEFHTQPVTPSPRPVLESSKINKSDVALTENGVSIIPKEDLVAIVNGVKISKEELEKNFGEALTASGANTTTLTSDQKPQGYRQILDGMIMEKLVDKASAGIKVEQAEIDAQLAKIKSEFPSEQVFLKEMKKSGLTIEKFTANLTKSTRQSKWMQSQVQGRDTVTDDDAKRFYVANTKEFANPDLVRASHILIRTPEGATPEQLKVAENKAKAAIARAYNGEDFGKLASELSEEPGAAQRGGDLGYFARKKMVLEFDNAAFAQKVGSISATPVKTKFGYHVIKVTDKKPAGTATFAEAKAQILQFLQAQKRREIFKGIMQELRQSADIQIFLPSQ